MIYKCTTIDPELGTLISWKGTRSGVAATRKLWKEQGVDLDAWKVEAIITPVSKAAVLALLSRHTPETDNG